MSSTSKRQFADYRLLHTCQYGVYNPHRYDKVEDCGDSAPYKVWWDDEEKDCVYICEEHLHAILDSEVEMEGDAEEVQHRHDQQADDSAEARRRVMPRRKARGNDRQ